MRGHAGTRRPPRAVALGVACLAGCALSHRAPEPGRDGGLGAPVCAEAVEASAHGWVALVADDDAVLRSLEAGGEVRERHRFFDGRPGEALRPLVASGSSDEVVAVWSRRPPLDCGGGGCEVEVVVFGPRGQAVWRSPSPTATPGEVRRVLPDGRFLVDGGRDTASRLVDPYDGSARTLDGTVLFLDPTASQAGFHPAVLLEAGGGRMGLVRPADGRVAPVPGDGRSIGAVWAGRWVLASAGADGLPTLVVTDGVGAGGGATLRPWADLPFDEPDPVVVVDGDRAILLGRRGASAGVPLAVADLPGRRVTPLEIEPPAAPDGRAVLTRVLDGFALVSVGAAPAVRVDLAAATVEPVDLEALAGPGARPLARGELVEPPRLLEGGRIALGVRTPVDAGWFVQPARDRPLERVGRAMHRVDAVVGRLASGTWWVEQIDGDPAGWPGEAPADAVVGNAVQLVRGERDWTFTPWPDVRARPSRSGLCAVVAEGGGLGAPARRLSILDLTRDETADVSLDPAGVDVLAY